MGTVNSSFWNRFENSESGMVIAQIRKRPGQQSSFWVSPGTFRPDCIAYVGVCACVPAGKPVWSFVSVAVGTNSSTKLLSRFDYKSLHADVSAAAAIKSDLRAQFTVYSWLDRSHAGGFRISPRNEYISHWLKWNPSEAKEGRRRPCTNGDLLVAENVRTINYIFATGRPLR